MSKPQFCYKCKDILTFCECDKPITDKDEYIEYLEKKIDKLLIDIKNTENYYYNMGRENGMYSMAFKIHRALNENK